MGRQIAGQTKEEAKDSGESTESSAPNDTPPTMQQPAMTGGTVGVPGASAGVQQSERVFEVAKVDRKQVIRTARVNLNGCITFLQAGQLVDSNNYDFKELKAQGVMLGDVGAE